MLHYIHTPTNKPAKCVISLCAFQAKAALSPLKKKVESKSTCHLFACTNTLLFTYWEIFSVTHSHFVFQSGDSRKILPKTNGKETKLLTHTHSQLLPLTVPTASPRRLLCCCFSCTLDPGDQPPYCLFIIYCYLK